MDNEVMHFPSAAEAAAILAPEPTEDPTNILTTDEERAIAARILPALAAKANALAEASKTKELEKVIAELRESNAQMLKAKIEELTKANKPLEPADVQKLVSQEYLEMPITLKVGRTKTERTFVLGELPQAVEQKILQKIQKGILPFIKDISAADWAAQSSVADKLTKLVELLPGTLDLMADIASVCLDPFGEEKIDAQWVAGYMSSKRIMDVIEGQLAVGRIRDFTSAVYRLFPQAMKG